MTATHTAPTDSPPTDTALTDTTLTDTALTDTTGRVVLDHGAGGEMSQELIAAITAALGDVYVGEMEDSAEVTVGAGRIAMTTDSFVVSPLFFTGGDIGTLAVAGTVNDLAVSGARPLYLTLAMIIEEGFPIADVLRVAASVAATARAAGVHVVAGDTKVVHRGEADGIYLNTAGVGVFDRPGIRLRSADARPGDQVIVTGHLGNHTVHLLSLREGLGFESRIHSDCAVLNHVVADVLDVGGPAVRCIRDVTRGGIATVLNEFAQACGADIELTHGQLPMLTETKMAAEMLGIDVMYLANEGVLCLVVDPAATDAVLAALRRHDEARHAALVGEVIAGTGRVYRFDECGHRRPVDLLRGAQLPRLC
jgi:hydrogenase expression/formation protein HypE